MTDPGVFGQILMMTINYLLVLPKMVLWLNHPFLKPFCPDCGKSLRRAGSIFPNSGIRRRSPGVTFPNCGNILRGTKVTFPNCGNRLRNSGFTFPICGNTLRRTKVTFPTFLISVCLKKHSVLSFARSVLCDEAISAVLWWDCEPKKQASAKNASQWQILLFSDRLYLFRLKKICHSERSEAERGIWISQ
jgi:hypothetical protein